MRFEIVTIFPGFFAGIFENGILRRALAEELVTVGVHDLRAFTHDRHRTVDDRPFGGGEGMVLKPEPLAEALAALGVAPKAARQTVQQAEEDLNRSQALYQGTTSVVPHTPQDDCAALQAAEKLNAEGDGGFNPRVKPIESTRALATEGRFSSISAEFLPFSADCLAPEGSLSEDPPPLPRTRVILLSAQGRPFTQALARELAGVDRVVLICGRYEGVDERINELYCDLELSIGDYVLSGGELAAAVVMDATMRLIPGVLGNEASGEFESFGVADDEIAAAEDGVPRSQHGSGGLLDYPHYTRPAEFAGLRVPETLLNGDHAQIRRWRREQQLLKTLRNRPDLLEKAALSPQDRKLLDAILKE
jgi:tRNA (guanine37-N1)-methyltransferase